MPPETALFTSLPQKHSKPMHQSLPAEDFGNVRGSGNCPTLL